MESPSGLGNAWGGVQSPPTFFIDSMFGPFGFQKASSPSGEKVIVPYMPCRVETMPLAKSFGVVPGGVCPR